MVFGGANTYNGGTTVSSGRLTISSTGSLASGSSLTVNGGNLVFNNAAQTVGAFSGSGGTINLGTGHALTVTPATTSIYSGVIAGAGRLIKAGAVTLTLSGANTYAGGTTLSAGVLSIENNNSLGTTGTIIFGGGTLKYSTTNPDYSARFSGAAGQQYIIDAYDDQTAFNSALTSPNGTLTKLGNGSESRAGRKGLLIPAPASFWRFRDTAGRSRSR